MLKTWMGDVCFWQSEEKDMGATIKHCDLQEKFGCEVNDECQFYISRDEVTEIIAKKQGIKLNTDNLI